MKIKINHEWLEKNVFHHEFKGQIWKQVIEDHNCIGEYQFDVNLKEGEKLGVRVGFFDDRLPRKKVYTTVTEGNYEIIEEVK